MIGGWDEREEARLRGLAARLGVERRTRFEGQREREELPAAYAAADAVVFPVIWEEPWGLVPLEAMGIGRPVVATGRGGSAEYLRTARTPAVPAGGRGRAGCGRGAARRRRRPARPARETTSRPRARHTERRFNEAVERFLREAVA